MSAVVDRVREGILALKRRDYESALIQIAIAIRLTGRKQYPDADAIAGCQMFLRDNQAFITRTGFGTLEIAGDVDWEWPSDPAGFRRHENVMCDMLRDVLDTGELPPYVKIVDEALFGMEADGRVIVSVPTLWTTLVAVIVADANKSEEWPRGYPVSVGASSFELPELAGKREYLLNLVRELNKAAPDQQGNLSASAAAVPVVPPFHPRGDLPKRFELLHGYAINVRNDLTSKYGSRGPDDPRHAFANQMMVIVFATRLDFIFLNEHLSLPDWWREHGFTGLVENDLVSMAVEGYVTLGTGALMVFAFSLFESALRRIVRAIDCNACGGGTAQFKSIYEWLLKRAEKDWTYSRGDPRTFLDLFRLFRNMVHNNGHFVDSTAKDQEVTWRGKTYRFEHGKVPGFAGWEFNLMLLRELLSLTAELMKAPLIAGIAAIA